jgi:hypothetical protein
VPPGCTARGARTSPALGALGRGKPVGVGRLRVAVGFRQLVGTERREVERESQTLREEVTQLLTLV